jgi:hypothetical protein
MQFRCWGIQLALACVTGVAGMAHAFQLAPTGSQFEAKLTNESPSWLARVAGKVGVLLKEPVHEEITQLAFGCPVDHGALHTDKACLGADQGFASHFVIYGVRWNDLPPFRLRHNEARGCKKLLGSGSACRVDQTVRFSTQPECWYCLFSEGQRLADKRTIAGCRRGKGISRGNLLTRSHFGDLQFLHAMASGDDVPATETQARILDWMEFAWKVATREFGPDTRLKSVQIPSIQEHFGCTEWTVADLYILGRNDRLRPRLHEIALGSVFHTLQDSFAGGHTTREENTVAQTCAGTNVTGFPRVLEFHSYGGQDGHKHDARDSREAMVLAKAEQWPLAVTATRHAAELYDSRADWLSVSAYLRCVFDLSPAHRASSPGQEYRRVP